MPRILLAALLCLFLAPTLKADDIVITSGGMSLGRPSTVFNFDFQGTNLSVIGHGDPTQNVISPYSFCLNGCVSSSLNSIFTGTDISGTITYNGVLYTLNRSTGPFFGATLGVTLTAPSFTIPNELRGAAGLLITAPFTLGGNAAHLGAHSPPFSVDFGGQGIVRLQLVNRLAGPEPSFAFVFENLEYEILPPGSPLPQGVTVTPVPEPATLLLFVTGLMGAAGRIRKSRKTRDRH